MKEAKASATKWATLYKKISQQHMAEPADAAKPVSQIGIAFLQWEATTKAADTAWARLWPALIDLNDMRVSHPHEIIEMIGSRYPRAAERVDRLHDVLQEIYVREHEMSMRSLQNKGKKEVRAYLESLPGIVPYVSAQILLICYEGHAIPVDQTLANLLKIQGVASEDASVEEIASFLDRQVKAGEGAQVHAVLRAWVDAGSSRASLPITKKLKKSADPEKNPEKSSAQKATKTPADKKTAKKTTKKTAKKATTEKKKKAPAKAKAATSKKKTTKRPVRKKR